MGASMKARAFAFFLLIGSVIAVGAQDQPPPTAEEAVNTSETVVVNIPDLLPEAARPVVADLLETLRDIERAADAGELPVDQVNPERERVLNEAVARLDDIVADDPQGQAAVALIGVRIAEGLGSPGLAAAFLRRMGDDAVRLPGHLRAQLELEGLRTGRAIARTGENMRVARQLIRPATVSPRQSPTLRSFGHYLMGRTAPDRLTALSYYDRAYLEAQADGQARQSWLAAMSALSVSDAAAIELWVSRLATAVGQEKGRDTRTTMVLLASTQVAPILGRDAVQALFDDHIERDVEVFAKAIRQDIVVGSLAGTYFAAAAMNAGWFDAADLLIDSAEACINDERWEEATGESRVEHLALIEQLRESNVALGLGERPTFDSLPVVCDVKIGEAVLAGAIKLEMKFRFIRRDGDENGEDDEPQLML